MFQIQSVSEFPQNTNVLCTKVLPLVIRDIRVLISTAHYLLLKTFVFVPAQQQLPTDSATGKVEAGWSLFFFFSTQRFRNPVFKKSSLFIVIRVCIYLSLKETYLGLKTGHKSYILIIVANIKIILYIFLTLILVSSFTKIFLGAILIRKRRISFITTNKQAARNARQSVFLQSQVSFHEFCF